MRLYININDPDREKLLKATEDRDDVDVLLSDEPTALRDGAFLSYNTGMILNWIGEDPYANQDR